ncbi:HigA family addiction module antitoxin [soil metagenome]|jgi:addiction module HigA family antidote|nr:HigA family addiction module antitoxin [Deinococcota bacterium]
MDMHNPPHPGEVLRELYLEPLALSVTAAAEGLGVTRKTLSAIVNGRAGISSVMAMRLAKAFGGSATSWLNMQQQHDLWRAKQKADLSGVRVLHRPTQAGQGSLR